MTQLCAEINVDCSVAKKTLNRIDEDLSALPQDVAQLLSQALLRLLDCGAADFFEVSSAPTADARELNFSVVPSRALELFGAAVAALKTDRLGSHGDSPHAEVGTRSMGEGGSEGNLGSAAKAPLPGLKGATS